MTRRRHLLLTALWCALHDRPPSSAQQAVMAVREWLPSWRGIGVIAAGMARQGCDLQLTRYAEEGWRATFYIAGKEHSATCYVGSAWERTPRRAVQGAASDALLKTGE
jgi:hypothetical protein